MVEHAHLGFVTTSDKSPSSALFEMVKSYWVSQRYTFRRSSASLIY